MPLSSRAGCAERGRPSIPDDEVAAWAVADDRIVIAEDKDFGYRVHVSAVPPVGVVFLRFPASARAATGPSRDDLAITSIAGRQPNADVGFAGRRYVLGGSG